MPRQSLVMALMLQALRPQQHLIKAQIIGSFTLQQSPARSFGQVALVYGPIMLQSLLSVLLKKTIMAFKHFQFKSETLKLTSHLLEFRLEILAANLAIILKTTDGSFLTSSLYHEQTCCVVSSMSIKKVQWKLRAIPKLCILQWSTLGLC